MEISFFNIIIVYLIVINIVSFVLFAFDKSKAILKKTRISEAKLFGVSLFGGSVGALLAMNLFRHKTKKNFFSGCFSCNYCIASLFALLFIFKKLKNIH